METRIGRRALDTIERHAVECYPEECCGIVLDGDDVRRIRNVQNELHARDPKAYPRDARIAYFMEPAELAAVLREVEERGRRIVLFYHSHPDHDAYFSEEDEAAATPFGEPSYPDAAQLVISVREGTVAGRILVRWEAAAAAFVEAALVTEG